MSLGDIYQSTPAKVDKNIPESTAWSKSIICQKDTDKDSLRCPAKKDDGADYKVLAEMLMTQGLVFAELVEYINDSRITDHTASVFRLSDSAEIYNQSLEQLGLTGASRV